MSAPESPTRTVVIDGRSFLWVRAHRHRGRAERAEASVCVEELRIWAANAEDSPLELEFVDGTDGGFVVSDGRHGSGLLELQGAGYDLERAETIEHMIRVAFAEGWDPRLRRSLVGANGFEWLTRHAMPS